MGKLRSIRKDAEKIFKDKTDYKPGGDKIDQYSRPEEYISGDGERCWKLIPIPDKKTDGTFLERRTHYFMGVGHKACPGQICRANPKLPCHKASRLWDRVNELDEKKDNSKIAPEEVKELDATRKEAGQIGIKTSHYYYLIDVTPAFKGNKQVSFMKDCYGDDAKREGSHKDCADCTWTTQCEERLKILRFNYGRKGHSNGEKFMAVWDDSPEELTSIYETEAKKGKIRTRPIKVTKKGRGPEGTNWTMKVLLNEMTIPEGVMDLIAEEMEPMAESVEKHIACTVKEMIKLSSAQEFDFSEDDDDDEEEETKAGVKRIGTDDEEDDEETEEEEGQEEEEDEEEDDEEEDEDDERTLEEQINDPDVRVLDEEDDPVCRGHYHSYKVWPKCAKKACDIAVLCKAETQKAKAAPKKGKKSSSKKLMTPEQRAKKEGVVLPKCFGKDVVFNMAEEPCSDCAEDNAPWVPGRCKKRIDEVPF